MGLIERIMTEGMRFALPVFFTFALGRGFWLYRNFRRGERAAGRREAALWAFVFYLAVLYGITVFSRRAGMQGGTVMDRLSHINFSLIRETWKLYENGAVWLFIFNAFGNVAWFMPAGLLWPLVRPGKHMLWKVLLFTFFLSFSIEILQLVTDTGISDVDDLILNTFGGFLGYLLYLSCKALVSFRKVKQKSG